MTFTVLNSGSLSCLSQKLSHDFIYNPKKQECHHRRPLNSSLIKQLAWRVSVTCLRLRMVRSMLFRSGGDSAWLSRAMGSPMSSSLVLSTSVSSGHLCTSHTTSTDHQDQEVIWSFMPSQPLWSYEGGPSRPTHLFLLKYRKEHTFSFLFLNCSVCVCFLEKLEYFHFFSVSFCSQWKSEKSLQHCFQKNGERLYFAMKIQASPWTAQEITAETTQSTIQKQTLWQQEGTRLIQMPLKTQNWIYSGQENNCKKCLQILMIVLFSLFLSAKNVGIQKKYAQTVWINRSGPTSETTAPHFHNSFQAHNYPHNRTDKPNIKLWWYNEMTTITKTPVNSDWPAFLVGCSQGDNVRRTPASPWCRHGPGTLDQLALFKDNKMTQHREQNASA